MLIISIKTADSNYCEPCEGAYVQTFSKQVASWPFEAVWRFPDLGHVKAITVFITRVHCAVLGRNLAQENTSWETPVIIASLSPTVLENVHPLLDDCILSRLGVGRQETRSYSTYLVWLMFYSICV